MAQGVPVVKDIIGKRYGSLVVVEAVGYKPKLWKCRCDCGKVCLVIRGQLTNRSRRTCGNCTSRMRMNSRDKTSYVKRLGHIRTLYGLEEQDLRDLMDKQKGCCAICKETLRVATGRSYHIDHEHSSGKVRGLLCNQCNVGLGMLGDSYNTLQEAARYIKNA